MSHVSFCESLLLSEFDVSANAPALQWSDLAPAFKDVILYNPKKLSGGAMQQIHNVVVKDTKGRDVAVSVDFNRSQKGIPLLPILSPPTQQPEMWIQIKQTNRDNAHKDIDPSGDRVGRFAGTSKKEIGKSGKGIIYLGTKEMVQQTSASQITVPELSKAIESQSGHGAAMADAMSKAKSDSERVEASAGIESAVAQAVSKHVKRVSAASGGFSNNGNGLYVNRLGNYMNLFRYAMKSGPKGIPITNIGFVDVLKIPPRSTMLADINARLGGSRVGKLSDVKDAIDKAMSEGTVGVKNGARLFDAGGESSASYFLVVGKLDGGAPKPVVTSFKNFLSTNNNQISLSDVMYEKALRTITNSKGEDMVRELEGMGFSIRI